MDAKQLLELIITPTHKYMGGNYQSDSSDLLSLCTAAIESDCGHFVKQVNGPALGIWQMEPDTSEDVWVNCDALKKSNFIDKITHLIPTSCLFDNYELALIDSPKYACAMARLKYSMDSNPLPKVTGNRKEDERAFYYYYKRVYNTELGKSTFNKWQVKMEKHKVFEVFYKLRGYSK
jgi:hypothetical protein